LVVCADEMQVGEGGTVEVVEGHWLVAFSVWSDNKTAHSWFRR
jgi:hypothetical protein